MKYSNFQKRFIVYICKYDSNVQGYLFKDILQSFLRHKNKYGLEVNTENVFILINKSIKINGTISNKYISEVYSLIYLLYELNKKELIYFSNSIISNDFKYSVTAFKNDDSNNINIEKEKSKFFLKIINSQIFISSDLRTYVLFKRFFFDTNVFIFWIGVLVSIATIISTIYDILTFHFKE
jgi:hypothetical protein|nr:MAG TPA: hypothetical protein [Caudoviricetes sp.]